MQQFVLKHSARIFGIFIFMLTCMATQAQEKIEINTEGVGSWFERNWMWVAGGVVLLLLIVLLSRGSGGRRKTTTVIKDAHGKTKSVTTTEEQI